MERGGMRIFSDKWAMAANRTACTRPGVKNSQAWAVLSCPDARGGVDEPSTAGIHRWARQQGERPRRITVPGSLTESDPEGQARVAALTRGLRDLGWTEGRNLRIEYRGITGGGIDRIRAAVAEILASNPDLVHATTTPIIQELRNCSACI